MSEETVKITIQIPISLDQFMRKIAALEGSTAEAWYERWLCTEFNAWMEELQGLPDIDMPAIVKHNGLEQYFAKHYASFLERLNKN